MVRVVIQRVSSASVEVGGEVVSNIGSGICVLVGIGADDTKEEAEFIARKCVQLRLFPDENGKMWTKSVSDLGLEVLLVSQFTLFGYPKGNKPDFHGAMKSEAAQEFFDDFVELMGQYHDRELIKTGAFGELMEVKLCNHGPVTMSLDSRRKGNTQR